MNNTRTYNLYTSERNAYCKLCSLSSQVNNNDNFKLKVRQYIATRGKYIEQTINVLCKKNTVEYYCEDNIKLLNIRYAVFPVSWNKYRQYIIGDVVSYNGKVYILKENIERGVAPTNYQWEVSSEYNSQSYDSNKVILYSDGRYYKTSDSVNESDIPGVSEKWENVEENYTLYCGVNGNGSHVEVYILEGNKDKIQLFPYDSELYYCNVSASNTINGSNVVIPKIISYEGNYIYGNIRPIKQNNNTIPISNNNTSNKLYYKIMTIDLIGTTRLDFTIRVQNLDFYDTLISGLALFSILGEPSTASTTIRNIPLTTTTFVKDNVNFVITQDSNNLLNIYFVSSSNRYKLVIEDYTDYSSNNTTRGLGSAVVDLINEPSSVSSISGKVKENMFW